MNGPFFSIIIPTLNEAGYLSRLLTDLQKQTEKSFEVFVVDAGSSDKTVACANAFITKLPLKVLTTKIKNVSVQRNLGAKKGRGEYLVFFDADVQIPVRFLSDIKVYLHHDHPDMVSTYIKADSRSLSDQMIARVSNLLTDMSKLIERPFVLGFNFIVKRDVFAESGGFRREVKHAEDIELSQRLFENGKTLTILKHPKLTFSLRRYREEGRLTVLRKNAKAALHVLTRGPITEEIFNYPMGGGWYGQKKGDQKQNGFEKAEVYVKKMVKLFFE